MAGRRHVYSILARDTEEIRFARDRQRFLTEQGYSYSIEVR